MDKKKGIWAVSLSDFKNETQQANVLVFYTFQKQYLEIAPSLTGGKQERGIEHNASLDREETTFKIRCVK